MTIVLVALVATVSAQDLSKDIAKMHQCYNDAAAMEMQMEAKIYRKAESVPTTTRAKLYKKGALFSSLVNKVQTLVNDKYVLMINHDAETMVLSEREKGQKTDPSTDLMPKELDNIIEGYKAVKYKGVIGSNKVYEIESDKGIIKKTTLYLDTKDYHIAKLEYSYNMEYSDIEKVEINYTVFKRNHTISSVHFDEKVYVAKNKKEWTPSAKYSAYYLMVTKD